MMANMKSEVFPLQRNITFKSHGNPVYQAVWYFLAWDPEVKKLRGSRNSTRNVCSDCLLPTSVVQLQGICNGLTGSRTHAGHDLEKGKGEEI